EHIKGRTSEGFNKTYGIVHPAEQWESNRGVRVSPFYEREKELGAVFYEAAAWERPHWYASNAPLVDEYGVKGREHEWDARWWSPIINAEHLAMRERAAMFDLTAFCVFDVVGPNALDAVQMVAARQMNVPNEAFPFSTWQELDNGVIASRISYVGDLGWELYAPMERGLELWDALWEAGRPHGVVPAGIGVYGTTGRLEKAYRAFGAELDQ